MKQKYDHLEDSLNKNLLQFYDTAMDEQGETIADDLASIDNRYSDFELIAEGGTKSVFKAMDNVVKRPIAYAQLLDDKKDNHESFLREARLTSLLNHPGIISVLDMGLEGEKPFFTMELKVGHSLGYILKKLSKGNAEFKEKYPQEKLLSIFIRICEAMEYAHSQGVIHLDLKPDNIQVGEFGEVLICDWGLGKLVEGHNNPDYKTVNLLRTQTLNGEIKGTPGFMAPEQIKKNGAKKKATDIYSLGAILYNILTHKPPHTGDIEDILKNTLVGEFPHPIDENSSISESLNAVTVKALEVKSQDRYQTVKEIKLEVEKFLSGYATQAENASMMKLMYLFYHRHQTLCITVSSALMIYFISSAFFLNKINNEKNEAVKQRNIAEGAKDYAEKSFKREQAARQSAERALQMYEEQKLLTTDYKTRILDTSKFFLRRRMYHPDTNKKSFTTILRDLKVLYEREPEDPEIKAAYGYLLFSMHNFREAEEVLKDSAKYGFLYKSIVNFHKKVAPQREYSTDEVIEMMHHVSEIRVEKAKSVLTHLLRFQALKLQDDFYKVVEVAFELFNEHKITFKYDNELNTLEVGQDGKRLKFHHDSYNFLRLLRVRQLKICGKLDNARTLSQLRVHILDLSESNCQNYEFLMSLFSLKHLIVRPDQLPQDLKKSLSRYVNITDDKSLTYSP